MLYSNIYKRYFPIKSTAAISLMSEKERKCLSHWLSVIKKEIEILNSVRMRKACERRQPYFKQTIITYSKEPQLLAKKIRENRDCGSLECDDIDFINDVIYRHKYNTFLAIFIFPIRREQTN